MENPNFNPNTGKAKLRPVNLSNIEKICLFCSGIFFPSNSKRKFCCQYCKHAYHYNASKEEFFNDRIMQKANRSNYKVLKEFVSKGILEVSRRDLIICGFNPNITAHFVLIENNKCAIYNDLGIYALSNQNFKIIKISKWK